MQQQISEYDGLSAKLKQLPSGEALRLIITKTMEVISGSVTSLQQSVAKLENDPESWLKDAIKESSKDNHEPTQAEVARVRPLFRGLKLNAYFGLFMRKAHLEQLDLCRKLITISLEDAVKCYEWISGGIGEEQPLSVKLKNVKDLKLMVTQLSAMRPYSKEEKTQMMQMIALYNEHIQNKVPDEWRIAGNEELKKTLLSLYKSRLQLLVTDLHIQLDLGEITSQQPEHNSVTQIVSDNKEFIVDVLPKAPGVLAGFLRSLVGTVADSPAGAAPGQESSNPRPK